MREHPICSKFIPRDPKGEQPKAFDVFSPLMTTYGVRTRG